MKKLVLVAALFMWFFRGKRSGSGENSTATTGNGKN